MEGYERVERDDRLLDVFTQETPARGVELWVKWEEQDVHVIRIHNEKKTEHKISRQELESALLNNKKLLLS